MYYGGLKIKRNWLGKPKYYAKFEINDEIEWIKISKNELLNLLIDYGNPYKTVKFVIGNNTDYHKIKGHIIVNDKVTFIMGEGIYGFSLNMTIYKEIELKLLATANQY